MVTTQRATAADLRVGGHVIRHNLDAVVNAIAVDYIDRLVVDMTFTHNGRTFAGVFDRDDAIAIPADPSFGGRVDAVRVDHYASGTAVRRVTWAGRVVHTNGAATDCGHTGHPTPTAAEKCAHKVLVHINTTLNT